MSVKNAGIIGIRMDATMKARTDRFYSTTGVEPVTLARAALNAALDTFEQTGTLTLPLRIVSAEAKTLQFPVKSESLKAAEEPNEYGKKKGGKPGLRLLRFEERAAQLRSQSNIIQGPW